MIFFKCMEKRSLMSFCSIYCSLVYSFVRLFVRYMCDVCNVYACARTQCLLSIFRDARFGSMHFLHLHFTT